METRGIRVRLTVWYAVTLAIGLLAYGGVVYALLRHSLSAELDRQVHADFERAEHAAGRQGDGLRWLQDEGHEIEGAAKTFVHYRKPDGTLLLRRPEQDVDSASYRVRTGPYAIEGLLVTISVGRSEARMNAELERILLGLALALPLIVALAAIGGFLLARRALAPVEASFEQLRRFTADASHELRTPLTAIRSVGEVGLQEQRDPLAYRDVIGSMLEETDRLTRMIDGLLTLSRADAGKVAIRREAVDLSALLGEVVEHLAVLAEEKQQSIQRADAGAVMASVDPSILRQALINLVDNAIKYAPTGSRIDVRAEERNGASLLEVRDEGPGIPLEDQARVFDRFYRVEADRGGASTGLGLSIASWAVEAHGGRIELESGAGGSTFRIVLPKS